MSLTCLTNVIDILKNVTNSLENIVDIYKKIFFKKNVQKIWWFLLFFISTSNTCKLSIHWVHLKIVISKKYVSTRHLTWKKYDILNYVNNILNNVSDIRENVTDIANKCHWHSYTNVITKMSLTLKKKCQRAHKISKHNKNLAKKWSKFCICENIAKS